MDKRILIIDGNSILFRAFFAIPPLKSKDGRVVNAVYGFLLIFNRAIQKLKPEHIVVCFDKKAPTFRHKIYKEYKGTRTKQADELYLQIPIIKKILGSLNINVLELAGFEADDLIGTIVEQNKNIDKIIVSGDKDLFQLINKNTKVWTMKKGIKDDYLLGEKEIYEKYELNPDQMIDMKAIMGDSSDNIPGVRGIGEKGAINLLKEYKTLDSVYKNIDNIKGKTKEKLEEDKEGAYLSQKLVTIVRDAPIELSFNNYETYNKEVEDIYKELGFNTFLEKREYIDELEEMYKDGILSDKIYKIEKNLKPVISKMEKNGIGVCRDCFVEFEKKTTKDLEKLEKEIFDFSGEEFNISSPKQVSYILFDKLDIPSKGIKKNKTGLSTSSPELEKIIEYPIVGLILKYRELSKLKTGFLVSLQENIEKDRIHPHFKQFGADTGRMSCENPNLQNIPHEVRKCFVPKEGYEFLSADYSQIEMRIVSHLSKDEKLNKFLMDGGDIHTLTAQEVFEKEEINKEDRKISKALNFGVLYGMGAHGVAKYSGIGYKEAENFIEDYFNKFPSIYKYREEVINQAREDGFVETMWGRKRFIPEINSRDKRLSSYGERMAINTKIQGTASDIIKLAMTNLGDILDNDCYLLLQIHDELLFEIKEDVFDSKYPLIKKAMESAFSNILVNLGRGKNWMELNSF